MMLYFERTFDTSIIILICIALSACRYNRLGDRDNANAAEHLPTECRSEDGPAPKELAAVVRRLLEKLANEDYSIREGGSKELIRLVLGSGEKREELIRHIERQAGLSNDLEVKDRVRRAIDLSRTKVKLFTKLHEFKKHSGAVWSVAFSPDDKLLASASEDGSVRIWNVQTGNCIHVLKDHILPVRSVAFSTDGRLLATAGEDGRARVWEVQSGKCLHVFGKHRIKVYRAVFGPDSRFLAVAGWDDNIIRVWDLESGKRVKTLKTKAPQVTSVAFRHDGKLLASSGSDSRVYVWNFTTGELAKSLKDDNGRIRSILFDPTGKFVVTGNENKTISIWDYNSARKARVLKREEYYGNPPDIPTKASKALGTPINTISLNSSGTILANANGEKEVYFWDFQSGKCLHNIVGDASGVVCIDFAHTDSMMAIAGYGDTITIWGIPRDLQKPKQESQGNVENPSNDK
jgi:WD40 repeat protein